MMTRRQFYVALTVLAAVALAGLVALSGCRRGGGTGATVGEDWIVGDWTLTAASLSIDGPREDLRNYGVITRWFRATPDHTFMGNFSQSSVFMDENYAGTWTYRGDDSWVLTTTRGDTFMLFRHGREIYQKVTNPPVRPTAQAQGQQVWFWSSRGDHRRELHTTGRRPEGGASHDE